MAPVMRNRSRHVLLRARGERPRLGYIAAAPPEKRDELTSPHACPGVDEASYRFEREL